MDSKKKKKKKGNIFEMLEPASGIFSQYGSRSGNVWLDLDHQSTTLVKT